MFNDIYSAQISNLIPPHNKSNLKLWKWKLSNYQVSGSRRTRKNHENNKNKKKRKKKQNNMKNQKNKKN